MAQGAVQREQTSYANPVKVNTPPTASGASCGPPAFDQRVDLLAKPLVIGEPKAYLCTGQAPSAGHRVD